VGIYTAEVKGQNFVIYYVTMQMMKVEILHVIADLDFSALSAND
jgi:hypothetical protein